MGKRNGSSASKRTQKTKIEKFIEAETINGMNTDRLTQRELLLVAVTDLKHVRCEQKKMYKKVEDHDKEIEDNTIKLIGISHDLKNHLTMHKKHIALITLIVSVIVAVSQVAVIYWR